MLCYINLVNNIIFKRFIFQRIDTIRILSEGEILFIEPLQIGNDDTSFLQPGKINFERCSIHCHQNIKTIAGGINFGASKMNLETGNTRNRSYRGANL